MKNLIIYYSYTGNNRLLAEHLGRLLGCDVYPVVEKNKRAGFSILLDLLFQRDSKIENLPISLQDYDHVLFIAPIWAARIANPLKTLIKNERDSIRQYSFVTLCGYESLKQKAKLSEQLNRLTGRPPQFVLEMRISDLFPIQDRKKINIISKYHIKPEDFSAYQNEINEIVSTVGSLPPPERGRPRESVSIH